MRRLFMTVLLACAASFKALALDCANTDVDVEMRRLLGKPENVCQVYGGKVMLVVNVASHCGFTPQYEGLEQVYKKYGDRGLVVLGFPSGEFGDQEFSDEGQIAKFCKANFGVSFPMFGRTTVLGTQANPLFRTLTARTGQAPDWNFNKYLVGRDGKVMAHFGSDVKPDSARLTQAIEDALERPTGPP
ncbi:MAG: glutathione peroxidase [Panacagrimonas sp.]